MDEMNIVSKFTTGIISKILNKIISKKLGYNVSINLNKITTKITDGRIYAHIDLDAELKQEELLKILKSKGLES